MHDRTRNNTTNVAMTRKVVPSGDFDAFLERLNIRFLTDKRVSAPGLPIPQDDPALTNACVHYFVSRNNTSVAPVADYLGVNFGAPCTTDDVYFMLTQKICYESLDPQGTEEPITYKLNETKFRALFTGLIASYIAPAGLLDHTLPCLFSLLDVNLYLRLPSGLLQEQFKHSKECLDGVAPLRAVNAQFNRFKADKLTIYPVKSLARVLAKEVVTQEVGYSKTTAQSALTNFYKVIDEEDEDESEGEGEEK
ncbi:hypothetical protein M8J76_006909 [Diaphorina citri]|nr:hypothetical protein M8J76_006909 [Diaphorina citri]